MRRDSGGRRVKDIVISLLFAIGALEVVGDGVGGDAEEPGGEGSATPFVAGEISERLVKDFRRKILGDGAVVDAADGEKVDALEMKLIKSVKFRRVGLRGFNEKALFSAWRRRLLCRTSDGHHGSGYSNWRGGERLRSRKFNRRVLFAGMPSFFYS